MGHPYTDAFDLSLVNREFCGRGRICMVFAKSSERILEFFGKQASIPEMAWCEVRLHRKFGQVHFSVQGSVFADRIFPSLTSFLNSLIFFD